MNQIQISTVICTRNRANYLEKAIESLIQQKISSEYYEILVIDNGSSDNTKALVMSKYTGVKNLRYIHEPVLGLSQARNTGFNCAKGSYIAYLDDDAIASELWLSHLLRAFSDPKVGAAGGPIYPIFEASKPGWFHDSLLPLYSCRDRGSEMFDLNPGIFFYGVNMAIKKDILAKAGGFRTDLGRKGSSLLSDEELEIFKEIEDAGHKKRYMPGATVQHIIPQERLKITWLLRRFYWMGKGHAIREKKLYLTRKEIGTTIFKKTLTLLKDLIRPKYIAGYYTRCVLSIYYAGYLSSMFFQRK